MIQCCYDKLSGLIDDSKFLMDKWKAIFKVRKFFIYISHQIFFPIYNPQILNSTVLHLHMSIALKRNISSSYITLISTIPRSLNNLYS